MNRDFGNRLWGASAVLWFMIAFGYTYPLWARIISSLTITYFFWFGAERFDGKYKKLI